MTHLWKTAEDALDYALAEEQKAVAIYRTLEGQAPSRKLKELFGELATEEEAHFKKLLRMRRATSASLEAAGLGRLPRPRRLSLESAGISDIESAYRYAIRAENGAARFYATMADMVGDPKIRKTLNVLVQEELGHKAKLEADLASRRSGRGFLKRLFRLSVGR